MDISVGQRRWEGWLALVGLLVACGGRADNRGAASGGSNQGGMPVRHEGGSGPNGGSSPAVSGSGGGTHAGGGATSAGGADVGAEAGAPVEGGNSGEMGGAGGAGGNGGEEQGGGGATSQAPIEVLIGNYDLYIDAPPVVVGCEMAWYEPRINLAVSSSGTGKLEALAFADFFWQSDLAAEPALSDGTFALAALSDWAERPLAPALWLAWGPDGFLGTGSAEIPYTCSGGVPTSRSVPVAVQADRTLPKLRVDPASFGVFAFTRFGFTFSEPVELPSGAFDVTFRDTSDAEQVVELYDVANDAALPIGWKWSLGGPIAQAHFQAPAAVEGRTIAARLLATVTDGAGNALVSLDPPFDVETSALLDDVLDFDQEPTDGLYGNASYHGSAGPGAECEQGGCLVLDGPVVACYEAPSSTLSVLLSQAWDPGIELRYRVWASTSSVSPVDIGFASGCTGSFSVSLGALAQPDGPFTHVSDWDTVTMTPCGGPENENGFTLSLACAEYGPPPAVRVVVERLTRVTKP